MGIRKAAKLADDAGEPSGADEPLMVLKGSTFGTNEWRPNVISIYSDRIEEIDAGFFKKSVNTIRFDQIARVGEKKGIAYTELTIESTGGGTMVAKGLSKAQASAAKQLLEKLVGASSRPVSGGLSFPPPPIDISDQIRKLGELRDQGLLSDTERRRQKGAAARAALVSRKVDQFGNFC